MAKQLVYGQRVRITAKAHRSHGRVGQYEGVITGDTIRVRMEGGVICARRREVRAIEHPVCAGRRARAEGLRPERPILNHEVPVCYVKDYGMTSRQLAVEAWLQAL